MPKKLFLLCPLIQGEMYLKEKFGNDCLFMTALGSVFDLHNNAYTESIIHLLLQEDITEIFHVHDIDSPFLKSVVDKKDTYNSTPHQLLDTLFSENYYEIMQESNKIGSLALIHMKHQANFILQHPKLASILKENKIALQGLLSQMSKRKSIQFDLQMAFQKL